VPDQPLVCFVLVNWRTERFLPAALHSIRGQTWPAVKTVLVNNASPTWDAAALPFAPDLLVQAPRNLGFAGGNNLGIGAALASEEWVKPEYICLLNCDARLEPDFLEHAMRVFAANPRIGSVIPKLLRDDGTRRIESAGHQMYLDRTTAHRGHNDPDLGHYDRGEFVFGGSAAAVVYRRAMLEEIAEGWRHGRPQVFDAAFFAYYEDVDLDWRAQLAGWQAYYEPRCVAWHHTHGSGGRRRWLLQLRAEKNRYLMLVKNDRLSLDAIGPLLTYETYHFARWLLNPWLWPAPLLFLWCLPQALHKRWRSKRSVAAASSSRPAAGMPPPLNKSVSAWFAPRGLAAAPNPQAPDKQLARSVEPGLVSVVVLNHNGLAMTRACIASLRAQTYRPLEIVLVDNGSADSERELLAQEYPEALLLPHNLGFTGGVNWGVSRATGEYIALVNNDSVLRPDCVEQLVAALQNDARIGGVSGRLVNLESFEQAAALAAGDPALGEFADPQLRPAWEESELNHGLSLFGFIVPGLYGNQPASFYPSGGLCLLRRSAVDELLPKLLPALYFAYHEDVWLGFRLRSRGWRVGKAPRAIAAHVEGSTARRTLNESRLRFLQERNRWLNILGWYPASVLLPLLPLLLLQAFLLCAVSLFSRPRRYLGIMAAHIWLLAHPLAIRRLRRDNRTGRTVPDRAWLAELSGQVRGRGGVANQLALLWCRLLRIPHREASKLEHNGPASSP
jgi:GT2 family glycosyltransferase